MSTPGDVAALCADHPALAIEPADTDDRAAV